MTFFGVAAMSVAVDACESSNWTTPDCEVVALRIVFFVAVISPFSFCVMESIAVIVVPLAVGSLFAVCFSLNSPSWLCQ